MNINNTMLNGKVLNNNLKIQLQKLQNVSFYFECKLYLSEYNFF